MSAAPGRCPAWPRRCRRSYRGSRWIPPSGRVVPTSGHRTPASWAWWGGGRGRPGHWCSWAWSASSSAWPSMATSEPHPPPLPSRATSSRRRQVPPQPPPRQPADRQPPPPRRLADRQPPPWPTVLIPATQLSGNWTSSSFTIAAGQWNIGWAFQCTPAPATTPTFEIFVVNAGGTPGPTPAVSSSAASGQSITPQSSLGSQQVIVQTAASCRWAVKVTGFSG